MRRPGALATAGLLPLAWALACARPPLVAPGADDPAPAAPRVPPVPEAATPCDRDGDGHLALACGGDDCDDANPAIHPGALDLNARPGPWMNARVLTHTGGSNGGTAIAVDRAGVVHIAYSGRSAPGLTYATRNGQAWRVELVDAFRNPYFVPEDQPALALDARGAVHVAYTASAGIRYAVRAASGWTVETIDPAGLAPPAIAVGPDGAVHVAYATAAGLRHAVRRDGAWVGEIVDPSGAQPSIALDGLGTVHVAYADATKGREVLRHAVGFAGAWITETASDTRAAVTSIVIDGLGLPRIVLAPRYTTDRGARYLVRSGGQWSETALPATNDVYSASLRVDGAGAPHVLVSYLIETDYVVQSSGTWNVETPVLAGLDDVRPSFDLDGAGVAHVAWTSFYFSDDVDLEYATNRQLAPDGVDQDCDGVDGVDADRDGHASLATGGDDCDDGDPTSPFGCH